MTVSCNWLALLLFLHAGIAPLRLPAAADKPPVWMGVPSFEEGRFFRELMTKPDDWKQTRAAIDVLYYADHRLDKQFTDEELRPWMKQINQWNLKFALEVGAIKPWGQTGQKTFNVQRKKWDRFQSLGAKLYAIAMDEPLLCCREHIHKTDEYALTETANFIALVRKNYPEMMIGDIETFPSIPVADHIWWLDALQKKLAEMKVRGLDFYRLDVNWANFIVQNKGSWKEVRNVESACRQRKLPFSLIYWASGEPLIKRKELADDSTWYISIMHQGYCYAMVDGHPDQIVVQSWLEAPPQCVPETGAWTYTSSVLDFTRRFVKAK